MLNGNDLQSKIFKNKKLNGLDYEHFADFDPGFREQYTLEEFNTSYTSI